MATYKQIQEYVRQYYNCYVKSCWIAHVKELNGLEVRAAPNRVSAATRENPCPDNKRAPIEEAMRHYGMI